ncbi:MAG TPA: hypothetical protein VK862_20280 [Afifellaceae bacterium]|nr:hypothetical protein [Afifellaceae bacterium]
MSDSDWKDDEPIPPFGRRKVRPPVTDEEKRERALEDFRKEAREMLEESRQRDEEEKAEAKANARKANIFRIGKLGQLSKTELEAAKGKPKTSDPEEDD